MANDILYSADYRHGADRRFSTGPNLPYDWKSRGVISRTAPSFLLRSGNKVLTKVVEAIDMWIISLLLAVEKVSKYKNFMAQ